MNIAIAALMGYLLGSINTAYLIVKAKGLDIRDIGSNNAGASNVFISVGKGHGVLVGVLDILKGFLAVKLAAFLFPENAFLPIVAGVCAVLGHIFPFWMKFRGGKGLATYMGLLLGINWRYFVAMAILLVAVLLITDFIGLGTITVAVTMPFVLFFEKTDIAIVAIFVGLGIVICCKHIINIRRILNKTEVGFLRKNRDLLNKK